MNEPLVPSVLNSDDDPEVVVDATYFVIRALRNSLRNYPHSEVSPESPQRAFDVATSALNEIQDSEGVEIQQLAPGRVRAYIETLEALSQQEFEAASRPDVSRGPELLDHLRAEHQFE